MDLVFISHVEEDRDLALEIATGLEASGLQTWYYERDSDPGPSYLIQVHHAIEKCAAVVLLISPKSIRSHQMTKEVARASDLGKPFIPVRFNISHAEFQQRQPEWNIALGAASSIPVPSAGVSEILPRIVRGIGYVGVSSGRVPSRNPEHEVSSIETSGVRGRGTIDAVAAAIPPPFQFEPPKSVPVATIPPRVAITQRGQIAAVIVVLVVTLGIGMFFFRANEPPAAELESLGRSTPPQAVSEPTSGSANRTGLDPGVAETPRDGGTLAAVPAAPSQASRAAALDALVAQSKRVAGDRPNAIANAVDFDKECARLLQMVGEERQKRGVSQDVLAELTQLERRLTQMPQEFAKYDRENRGEPLRDTIARLEDSLKTGDSSDRNEVFEAAKRQITTTSHMQVLISELLNMRNRLASMGLRHITG